MPSSPRSGAPLLTPDLLRAIERASAVARRAPARPSRPLGAAAAGEVRDRRDHAPGDDPRAIDWPAYARLERLLVRLFEAEAPRDAIIALDASASMGHPQRKFRRAQELAAAIALLLFSRRDRVRLLALTDRVLAERAAGQGGREGIVAFVEGIAAGGPSAPLGPCRELAARAGRRSLIVLLTDALFEGDPDPPLRALAAPGHDVTLVHVEDPLEREPPLEGALRLIDAETGEGLPLEASAGWREALRAVHDAHAAGLAEACRRLGVRRACVSAAGSLEAALLDVLREGGIG